MLTRAADLPTVFTDLLDAPAVDELISARGLRTPFLRMAKDGEVLAAARFTRGGGAGASITDQAADDKVLALVGDGATLVLQGLHRTWPPLVDFATRLSDELGHPVQVNAYITPPQNRGFAPHYDVHDVFVLQVAGRKHWRIHAPVVVDPLADDAWEKHRDAVTSRADDTPLIDAVLEPGDALYLPRGTIHSATALGETSIHLTVGIHPVTRHDLVRHLLESARHDPALRASLPMGADLADSDTLAPQLAATLDALRAHLDAVDTTAIAERVGADLRRSTRPEPIAALHQLALAEAVRPGTAFRLRVGLHPSVRQDDDGIHLRLLDRTVSTGAGTAAALKIILAGAAFTPAQLPELSGDEQLELARHLLRSGVIVPAS